MKKNISRIEHAFQSLRDKVSSIYSSPEIDYINSLPEIVRAKKDGILRNIIYSPSNLKLEDSLRDSLAASPLKLDSETVEAAEKLSVRAYGQKKNIYGTIYPNLFYFFGQQVPVSIIITPEAIRDLRKKEEFRALAIHELTHVKDFHNGIKLGDISIRSIPTGRGMNDFLDHLFELRAGYSELEYIHKEISQTGDMPVRTRYFLDIVKEYAKHWNAMHNTPQIGYLEEGLRGFQFEQFKGIRPETINGNQVVYFDLFENQRAVEL